MTGTATTDAAAVEFYNTQTAAEAFTQTAHADLLRQLWDTATDLGAERSSNELRNH